MSTTKRILTLVLAGLAAGSLISKLHSVPQPRVKGPTVRYHSYPLNHKAIHTAKLFTVLISAEGWGGIARGTGILIDSTHILTCAHVALHGNDETWVYFFPGYLTARAKVVFSDASKDLAIMEIDVPVSGAPVPVFQETRSDGEPITVIGNALGAMKWYIGYGIVSGGNGIYVYTDALVKGGDSGGPWINDAGEVVAVSDWGLRDRSGRDLGINGGISAETVNEFLRSWKKPASLDLLQGLFGRMSVHKKAVAK